MMEDNTWANVYYLICSDCRIQTDGEKKEEAIEQWISRVDKDL